MLLIPTILCGGAGSRLWPVSREHHPKPFIRLSDGQSLLQKAFLRGATQPDVKQVLTVTNRELLFNTEDEFRQVNKDQIETAFILEPFGKNTAAAIAAASLSVASSYGKEAVLLVLPADHLILDQEAFSQAVAKAASLAASGKIVTFGIKPDVPETGYGYIEANNQKPLFVDAAPKEAAGYEVSRFVEKPNLATAQQYLESGSFFWNSGMFCFAVGTMLDEMQRYCPDILSATRLCMDNSRSAKGSGFSQLELNAEFFQQVPENSIDYAVLERSPSVAVVPCDIGWSDIGSWSALGNLAQPDANGNRIDGEVVMHEVRDCYVQSADRMVGLVGVQNLIVIDTPDALLVADKSKAQDVKHIYGELKKQGHETFRHHLTVKRPWGSYTVLEEGVNFKIKRIVVKPGASLSLQLHHHRSEHWVVVSGMAQVVNGDQVIHVNTNESTYIPAGRKHRLSNPGIVDLAIIEVQSGQYLGEDDIVRFEDNYGRIA